MMCLCTMWPLSPKPGGHADACLLTITSTVAKRKRGVDGIWFYRKNRVAVGVQRVGGIPGHQNHISRVTYREILLTRFYYYDLLQLLTVLFGIITHYGTG